MEDRADGVVPGGGPRLIHSVTKLSFIPEKERAVAHRFTLVLCGDGAASLARSLCTSDASEEYRPRRKAVETPGLAESDSERRTLFGGTRSGGSTLTSRSRKCTEDLSDLLHDEFTTLFVPMSQHLCRVRFVPVDAFSISLPIFSDKAICRDTAVVFLYQGSSESKGAAVDEAIQDFRARVAELNFHSEHVPLVVLLCVTPGEGDLERLQEFAGAAKLRTGAPVRVVEAGDDSEDGLILTVIDIAELLRRHKGGWSRIVDSSGGRRRSQCCALV